MGKVMVGCIVRYILQGSGGYNQKFKKQVVLEILVYKLIYSLQQGCLKLESIFFLIKVGLGVEFSFQGNGDEVLEW